MTLFILLTTLTVSIDSFICGFSLSYVKGKKFLITVGITVVVFLLCLITNSFASFLSPYLSEREANLGGIILVAVGIYNLVKKDEKQSDGSNIFKQSIITGFAVGLDGALANLSFSLMGFNSIIIPLFIAFMHAVMITLGILFSKFPLFSKIEKFSFVPPLILIALGIYKLTMFFI